MHVCVFDVSALHVCCLPCPTLRNSRYRENRDRESQPDSLQLHMETRFEQLKVRVYVCVWGGGGKHGAGPES